MPLPQSIMIATAIALVVNLFVLIALAVVNAAAARTWAARSLFFGWLPFWAWLIVSDIPGVAGGVAFWLVMLSGAALIWWKKRRDARASALAAPPPR